RRIETVYGAARQHHAMHRLDKPARIKRIGFAGARRPAAQFHRRDRVGIRQHHCHPGEHALVLGVADEEAADVGNKVARSGLDHGSALRFARRAMRGDARRAGDAGQSMLGTACRAVLAVVVAALLLAVSACGDGRGPAMVSTANPHASTAAIEILRRGGSAIDAAIAAQLVLGLVEPQSSGLGGGAFLLHWDAGSETVEAYDGRETAPAAARPDLFLKPDGTPMPFMEAVVGGRAVGVPGLVAMLAMAHRDHGVLDWASLFEPAIELAETGFTVSPRLHAMISAMDRLAEDPAARAYFYADTGPGVSPLPVGHRLRNPAYARTLRIIAEQGPEGFYHGEIAEAIVAAVTGHANPGAMTLEDLAGYE